MRDQSRAEARERLQRFALAWHTEYVRPGPLTLCFEDGTTMTWQPPSLVDELLAPGLDEAAFVTLRAVQADLLALESPVEDKTARALMRDRRHAFIALLERYLPKRTKEKLLDLTDGAPLTICMGDAYAIRGTLANPAEGRWKKKHIRVRGVGDVGFTVKGCRSIIPESTRTTGWQMWRRFCEDCRSDKRHPHRDQGRDLRSDLSASRLGADATVYASMLHITDGDGE
jgi:hypothetical protein